MRVLAIDHGARRIGVAISDVTGTLARPLAIVTHTSRQSDANRIIDLAKLHHVETIIVGDSTDEAGQPNQAGHRARNFAWALRALTAIPVIMWDESLSSQDARNWRMAAGAPRKRRAAPIDDAAAAIILQSYLDSQISRRGSDGT